MGNKHERVRRGQTRPMNCEFCSKPIQEGQHYVSRLLPGKVNHSKYLSYEETKHRRPRRYSHSECWEKNCVVGGSR